MEAGSANKPYKLAIVGGGPSGCSVIVRAMRLQVMTELCSGTNSSKSLSSPSRHFHSSQQENGELGGVCLFDADDPSRFGGGRFQDYIINSNTYAGKFVTNVTGEKLDIDPPERVYGTPLAVLKQSPWAAKVELLGNTHVALNTVGGFLRDVGTCVHDTLTEYPDSRVLNQRVIGLQRCLVPVVATEAASASVSAVTAAPLSSSLLSTTSSAQVAAMDPLITPPSSTIQGVATDLCAVDSQQKSSISSPSKKAVSDCTANDMSLTSDSPATTTADMSTELLTVTDTDTASINTLLDHPSVVVEEPPKRLLWRIEYGNGRHPGAAVSCMSGESASYVFAKTVVLATGGCQVAPTLPNPAHNAKVMVSDHACTAAGVAEIKERLLAAFTASGGGGGGGGGAGGYVPSANANANGGGGASGGLGAGPGGKSCRVLIIGGSHSAFSAAWICINKLMSENVDVVSTTNTSTTTTSSTTTATAPPSSPVRSSTASSGSIPPATPSSKTAVAPSLSTNSVFAMGNSSVIIAHRSSIKVFYSTKKEADNDNYADIGHINKTTGHIHPFGGLRGDAKELFRAIKSGRESRVRLVSTKGGGQSLMNKLCEDATVIIWACGYTTNMPPVRDLDGSLINIRYDRGQVEVDEEGHILMDQVCHLGNSSVEVSASTQSSKNAPPTPSKTQTSSSLSSVTSTQSSSNAVSIPCPVGGLMGSGLGFGFKATFDNGELDGSSGRADGVAVYLKRGATLVLASVLGPKVFGNGCRTWAERTAFLNSKSRPSASGPPGTPSEGGGGGAIAGGSSGSGGGGGGGGGGQSNSHSAKTSGAVSDVSKQSIKPSPLKAKPTSIAATPPPTSSSSSSSSSSAAAASSDIAPAPFSPSLKSPQLVPSSPIRKPQTAARPRNTVLVSSNATTGTSKVSSSGGSGSGSGSGSGNVNNNNLESARRRGSGGEEVVADNKVVGNGKGGGGAVGRGDGTSACSASCGTNASTNVLRPRSASIMLQTSGKSSSSSLLSTPSTTSSVCLSPRVSGGTTTTGAGKAVAPTDRLNQSLPAGFIGTTKRTSSDISKSTSTNTNTSTNSSTNSSTTPSVNGASMHNSGKIGNTVNGAAPVLSNKGVEEVVDRLSKPRKFALNATTKTAASGSGSVAASAVSSHMKGVGGAGVGSGAAAAHSIRNKGMVKVSVDPSSRPRTAGHGGLMIVPGSRPLPTAKGHASSPSAKAVVTCGELLSRTAPNEESLRGAVGPMVLSPARQQQQSSLLSLPRLMAAAPSTNDAPSSTSLVHQLTPPTSSTTTWGSSDSNTGFVVGRSGGDGFTSIDSTAKLSMLLGSPVRLSNRENTHSSTGSSGGSNSSGSSGERRLKGNKVSAVKISSLLEFPKICSSGSS